MRKTTFLAILTAALAIGLANSADAQVSLNLGNPYNGGWTVGSVGGHVYAAPTTVSPYAGYGGLYNNGYTYNSGYNGYSYNSGYNGVYNNGRGWNAATGLTATPYNSGYAGYTAPAVTTYHSNFGSTPYYSGYHYGYPANYGAYRGYNRAGGWFR
jgi:hypothetical protein